MLHTEYITRLTVNKIDNREQERYYLHNIY